MNEPYLRMLFGLADGLRRLNMLYKRSIDGAPQSVAGLVDELAALRNWIAEEKSEALRDHYVIYAQLIGLRVRLDADALERPKAYTYQADSTGSESRECEESLKLDPAQPALWLAAATAHWREGNFTRAKQLLRRLTASGFPEAAQAQAILADLVYSKYKSPLETQT